MDLYSSFKKMAFKMDPEKVHDYSFKVLSMAPWMANVFPHPDIKNTKRYQVKLHSMTWPFPVGLAAGLDKNGVAIDFFSQLGFGAVEVGTVTPLPQEGNPRPRLFRYPEEESLRNCMGFNNRGSHELVKTLRKRHKNVVLGVNIGKNKVTPQEKAIEDYLMLYKLFASEANYLVINVSSPNTPGLRDLQQVGFLQELFTELKSERLRQPIPLFLKIAPDLEDEDIFKIVEIVKEHHLSGIIATNTTHMPQRGEGGISGKLLAHRSKKVRKLLLERTRDSTLDIIGVGGISSFEDIKEFWDLGGKVCQVYTALIYQGPRFLQSVQQEISKLLEKNACPTLEDYLSLK